MKKEYICIKCKKKFKRYKSTVRNEKHVYCSRKCKDEHQKTLLLDENNPNYKGGGVRNYITKKRFCQCGQQKRVSNVLCWLCKKKTEEHRFILIVSHSDSYLDVSIKLETSRQTVMREIKRLNLDISHFNPGRGRYIRKEDLFKKGIKRQNGTIKTAILRDKLIEYECSKCELKNMWNNKKITLQLDHINGNSSDNRLENLRFLCPNCHSQTDTFTGKNRRNGVSGGKDE